MIDISRTCVPAKNVAGPTASCYLKVEDVELGWKPNSSLPILPYADISMQARGTTWMMDAVV